MKGVTYLRLSQESDRSIPSQKEDTQKYCKQNNIEIVEEFNDGQNSSGFNNKRPKYIEMKQTLAEKDIEAVVIRDRTRLGRDFDERMRFILDLREMNVELHTWSDGQVDLEDPYSVAVEGIHSASDDKKKREEIKKAKHELKKREENNCYQGRPPFGLEFGENNCHLVRGEDFDKAVEVLELREDGNSYPEIESETGIGQSKAWRICKKNREKYEELRE